MDSKTLLLNIMPTQCNEHGEVERAYIEPPPPSSSVFGRGIYSAIYQKININTNPGTKSLIFQPS